MLTGIYCITNKINNKIYIGQSNNIISRWSEHYRVSLRNDERRKSLIHKAIIEYGIENFTFEILETCNISELNDLEIKYIKEFKENGYSLYNLTDGGESNPMYGEDNPRHILSDKEVYDIRERYNNRENKSDIYNLYKDRITFSGFNDIWRGKSRKYIHMDVYTKENKEFHRKNFKKDLFSKSNFTEDDVRKIRDLKQSGYPPMEVHEMYKFININTFNDIWYYHTFPNIKSDLEKRQTRYIRRNQNGTKNSKAKYTEEQIIDIRRRKANGEKLNDVYELYPLSCKESFRNIWNNKTYKNIGVIENEISK